MIMVRAWTQTGLPDAQKESMTEQAYSRLHIFLTYLVLAVSTLVAYESVRHNDFVGVDDAAYVTDNPSVKGGITYESVVWAFTTSHVGNWHPLTWLSHILDCQLFGLNPLGHHLTNLLFHIANTLLLFWVLKEMTGDFWPSAFVSAAFALHPLHVESVAWVSERKDVLSTLFWFLTMIAYVQYAKKPGIKRYALVILALALGLMAKPMLVTLPFVLLLLDYWPLGRFHLSQIKEEKTPSKSKPTEAPYQSATAWRLISEKFPLFILAAVSSIITFIIQQSAGAMELMEKLPLSSRISNALLSYVSYIGKMIYPSRLAVLYPLNKIPSWQPFVMILVAISVLVFISRRRYLTVGWLWYLGTLVPVIGIVQVGPQAMADRYTYVPSIGLLIIIGWGLPSIIPQFKYKKIALVAVSVVVLLSLILCTRRQVSFWQNSFKLFSHALSVTNGNPAAHSGLAKSLFEQNRLEEALFHYKEVLKFLPNHAKTHGDVGLILLKQGKLEEAVIQFRRALALDGDTLKWHSCLALALHKLGRVDEAIIHYQQALKLYNEDPLMHNNLANALLQKGKPDDAIKHYEYSIQLKPEQPDVMKILGSLHFEAARYEQAIDCWTKAVQLRPDFSDVLNNLAWILATAEDIKIRNPSDAVEYAKRACELTNYNQPEILDTLAVAYAAAGNFPEAVKTAEEAIVLAEAANKEDMAKEIQQRLQLYKSGQPYREK